MSDISVRGRRIMIDARLGLGSGIGRYVRNIVPRVANRMADIRFDLVVAPDEAVAMARFLAGRTTNVTVCPDATSPFSLHEQIGFVARSRDFAASWFVNYWLPLRWPGKAAVVVHDLLHLRPDLFETQAPKRLLSRAVFHKIRRSAQEVIFISRFTEREFHDRVGPPQGYASVIHHGVDHFDLDRPTAMPPKRHQMIVVAAAKRHKNFPLIVEAWRRSGLSNRWRLVIVTPGDALRSSTGLEVSDDASISVRQGVDDAALWALYRESAVVLMPSSYEGFGLPLLEGMLHGCLPICATADALVEVGAGGNISFVPARDVEGWASAMTRMADRVEADPTWLNRLGQQNIHHAHAWRWDDSADKTAAVLDRLLAVDRLRDVASTGADDGYERGKF